jgi:hypothetical protein
MLFGADGRRFATGQTEGNAYAGSSRNAHDDQDLRGITMPNVRRRWGFTAHLRRSAGFRRGAGCWSRSRGRRSFRGKPGNTNWRRRGFGSRGCWGWSSPAYLAERHLVGVGDRDHLGSSLRGSCIENAAYRLYGSAYQVVESWPLELVGDVRSQIGNEKMPVAPGMVLTQDSMHGYLGPRGRKSLWRRFRGRVRLARGGGWGLGRILYSKSQGLACLQPSDQHPCWIANLGGSALGSYLEMRPVLHVHKDGALRRQRGDLQAACNQYVRTALSGRSTLQDTIIAKYLDGSPRLKKEIGAAWKHEIRRGIACLNDIALEQGRIASDDGTIDLHLPPGDDKPHARRRSGNAHQAATGEQGNRGL